MATTTGKDGRVHGEPWLRMETKLEYGETYSYAQVHCQCGWYSRRINEEITLNDLWKLWGAHWNSVM